MAYAQHPAPQRREGIKKRRGLGRTKKGSGKALLEASSQDPEWVL